MKDFRDRVAAISGAGGGIGRALALRLAREGCHLALADIDEAGLGETVEMLQASGVRVSGTVLDVADEAAVYAWAETTAQEHGAVHVIVNNAGVALSGTVASLPLEDYRWIMDINFWGVVYGTKAFLPHLEAAGQGHIVNLSSVFGLTAQPLLSGYNASKFAVRGFTESLRQDLELTGSPVSATCVHPGGIRTNIARSTRYDPSTRAVTGRSDADAIRQYEALFRTEPAAAAETILRGVRKNKRRVLIGLDARGFDAIVRVVPGAYQRLFTEVIRAGRSR